MRNGDLLNGSGIHPFLIISMRHKNELGVLISDVKVFYTGLEQRLSRDWLCQWKLNRLWFRR